MVFDLSSLLSQVDGFDWDAANLTHLKNRHNVDYSEAEAIFSNTPVLGEEDKTHSITEQRWYAFGRTGTNRLLAAIFTIRYQKIRVLSARDMSKAERRLYLPFLIQTAA